MYPPQPPRRLAVHRTALALSSQAQEEEAPPPLLCCSPPPSPSPPQLGPPIHPPHHTTLHRDKNNSRRLQRLTATRLSSLAEGQRCGTTPSTPSLTVRGLALVLCAHSPRLRATRPPGGGGARQAGAPHLPGGAPHSPRDRSLPWRSPSRPSRRQGCWTQLRRVWRRPWSMSSSTQHLRSPMCGMC